MGIYIKALGICDGDLCLEHGHSPGFRFKAIGLSDIIPIDTIAETHEGFKAWVPMPDFIGASQSGPWMDPRGSRSIRPNNYSIDGRWGSRRIPLQDPNHWPLRDTEDAGVPCIY